MQVDDVVIHDTDRYAAQGYPWADWDLLRDEAPVYWYVRDNIVSFWAVVRLTLPRRVHRGMNQV